MSGYRRSRPQSRPPGTFDARIPRGHVLSKGGPSRCRTDAKIGKNGRKSYRSNKLPELPNVVIRKLAERELHRGASHPDADLLTAFVERALPDRERGTVLTHLAACAPCREIVALAQPAEIDTSTVLATNPSRSLFLLRWGALAA